MAAGSLTVTPTTGVSNASTTSTVSINIPADVGTRGSPPA